MPANTLKTALLPLSLVLLLGTGCGVAHGPGGRQGLAPALRSEQAAHNVANPNAPFSVRTGAPVLSQRPQLLDVDNVQPCSPSQLTVWESGARSSGNRHSLRFAVGNAGEACRLRGFPSISLLRADGSILGEILLRKISSSAFAATLAGSSSPEKSPSAPSPAVLLPSRGEASFELGWTAGSSCEPVSRIAIGVPGAGRAVIVPRQLLVCEKEVLITAIAPSGADE